MYSKLQAVKLCLFPFDVICSKGEIKLSSVLHDHTTASK